MWVYVLDNVIPAQVNNSMTDFIWNTLWWCTDAVFIGISMNMQYNNSHCTFYCSSCLETKVTSACTGYSDLRCTSCLWMRNIRQALMEMNFSFMNTKADVFGPIWMKPYLYLCQSHLSWSLDSYIYLSLICNLFQRFMFTATLHFSKVDKGWMFPSLPIWICCSCITGRNTTGLVRKWLFACFKWLYLIVSII